MHGVVKSKPVLFNTAMVQAILDGRKTVTRRVVKPQPTTVHAGKKGCFPLAFYFDCSHWVKPPYQVGDVLWVRETFYKSLSHGGWRYLDEVNPSSPLAKTWKKVPSIHMPKEAARIFLKVTDVRVERLQDIDDEQAKAEGANFINGKNVGWEEKMRKSAIDRFSELWNSTIKKKDLEQFGWDANPWVFVYEFERCADEAKKTE